MESQPQKSLQVFHQEHLQVHCDCDYERSQSQAQSESQSQDCRLQVGVGDYNLLTSNSDCFCRDRDNCNVTLENDCQCQSPSSQSPRNSDRRTCIRKNSRRWSTTYYIYGIVLVCFGGALNWFAFVQQASISGLGRLGEPIRYIGLACVIIGSLCVLFALCHWLGKPFLASASSHGLTRYQEDYLNSRLNCDVQIISVPTSIIRTKYSYLQELHKPPPNYEQIIQMQGQEDEEEEPPSYFDAIKFSFVSEHSNYKINEQSQV